MNVPRYVPPVADLSRYGGTWGDRDVVWHGSPENPVWLGRRTVHFAGRIWPSSSPEWCTAAAGDTTWVADEQLLICNGCGLDCT